MLDRISAHPGRVKLIPVEGQANTYDLIMADEPTQEGDAPVKANLLSDDAVSLYGLDVSATPNDVFKLLGAIPGRENLQLVETFDLSNVEAYSILYVFPQTETPQNVHFEVEGTGTNLQIGITNSLTDPSVFLGIDSDRFKESTFSSNGVTSTKSKLSFYLGNKDILSVEFAYSKSNGVTVASHCSGGCINKSGVIRISSFSYSQTPFGSAQYPYFAIKIDTAASDTKVKMYKEI